MIVGIGLDILETARLERALERSPGLLSRVFTEQERHHCDGRADRVQALAARFAAKEACLKALGTGWARGLAFQQVEVVREAGEKPQLVLHGRAADRARELAVTRLHVSLTHQPGLAAAVVVLESSGA